MISFKLDFKFHAFYARYAIDFHKLFARFKIKLLFWFRSDGSTNASRIKELRMFQVQRWFPFFFSSTSTWNAFVKLSAIYLLYHTIYPVMYKADGKSFSAISLCMKYTFWGAMHKSGNSSLFGVRRCFLNFGVVFSHGEVINWNGRLSGSTRLRTVHTCWHTTIIRDCLLEPSACTSAIWSVPHLTNYLPLRTFRGVYISAPCMYVWKWAKFYQRKLKQSLC